MWNNFGGRFCKHCLTHGAGEIGGAMGLALEKQSVRDGWQGAAATTRIESGSRQMQAGETSFISAHLGHDAWNIICWRSEDKSCMLDVRPGMESECSLASCISCTGGPAAASLRSTSCLSSKPAELGSGAWSSNAHARVHLWY